MSREDVKKAVQEEIARKRARIEDGILTEEARRITNNIKKEIEKNAIYNFNRGSKKFNIVKYLDNFLTKQKIVELVEIKFSGQAPGRKLTEKESQRVKIVSQKVLTNFAETKTEFFQDIYNIASSVPTIAPSVVTTTAPTILPTEPTTVPSVVTTTAPAEPSGQPSGNPSVAPTTVVHSPTLSAVPTTVPTTAPVVPSVAPSIAPTTVPTTEPSDQPSDKTNIFIKSEGSQNHPNTTQLSGGSVTLFANKEDQSVLFLGNDNNTSDPNVTYTG